MQHRTTKKRLEWIEFSCNKDMKANYELFEILNEAHFSVYNDHQNQLQWLKTCSIQGIMVFICYVALNKQVTDHWLTKFGMKKNVATNSGNNSANTKSSSCNQQDSAANSKARAENVYENRIVVEGCTKDVTPL